MTSKRIKPCVLDSDKLGRDIQSRSDRRKIKQGQTPSSVFLDNASPTEISVSRLTPEPNQAPPIDRPDLAPDDHIAKISDRRTCNLGRNFYGWAEVSVEDAGQRGRTVRPTPKRENKWHADIALPAEAGTSRIKRKQHAEDLAGNAAWRPRPA